MGQTALQIILRSSAVIAPDEQVIFNDIKYTAGNVSYNPVTGELVLLSAGRYVIDWWLAVQSSPSTNGASFALESSQGDLIEGNSPIKTDEVYGIGIIDVAAAPVTVVLKSIATAPMYLSTVVPLQGTLVLLEDVLAGPTGPTGPDGLSAYEVAVENGFVGTEQEWLDSLVGPTGPAGEAGPIAATIPFSLGGSGVVFATQEDGYPQIVNFAGFGKQNYYVMLAPDEWQTGTITFTEGMSYGTSFVMPYDGVLQSLYVVFSSNYTIEYDSGVVIRPFACIATCNTDDLIYVIQQETMIYTDPYLGGAPIPAHTLRKASATGLSVPLAAGTMVGIVLGIMSEGSVNSQSAQLNASGGLFIE